MRLTRVSTSIKLYGIIKKSLYKSLLMENVRLLHVDHGNEYALFKNTLSNFQHFLSYTSNNTPLPPLYNVPTEGFSS